MAGIRRWFFVVLAVLVCMSVVIWNRGTLRQRASNIIYLTTPALYSPEFHEKLRTVAHVDLLLYFSTELNFKGRTVASWHVRDMEGISHAVSVLGTLTGIFILDTEELCANNIQHENCLPAEVALRLLRSNNGLTKVVNLRSVVSMQYNITADLNVAIRTVAREAHWISVPTTAAMQHLQDNVGVMPDKVRVIPISGDYVSHVLCLVQPLQSPNPPLPEIDSSATLLGSTHLRNFDQTAVDLTTFVAQDPIATAVLLTTYDLEWRAEYRGDSLSRMRVTTAEKQFSFTENGIACDGNMIIPPSTVVLDEAHGTHAFVGDFGYRIVARTFVIAGDLHLNGTHQVIRRYSSVEPHGLLGCLLWRDQLSVPVPSYSECSLSDFLHPGPLEDNRNLLSLLATRSPQAEPELVLGGGSMLFMSVGEIASMSGMATVNRHTALEIMTHPVFRWLGSHRNQMGQALGEEELLFRQLLRQTHYDLRSEEPGAAITWRCEWPPDWSKPSSGIWLLQQPWELTAIPQSWVPEINRKVDALIVPTSWVKRVFVDAGVQDDKVVVVSYGVDPWRAWLRGERMRLPTSKKFKFLFTGGMLHRKGIDILIRAYRQAFSRHDDVSLVIHSNYGVDDVGAFVREASKANDNFAEIVFLGHNLPFEEKYSLFRSVDVFVSAHRGEGFGLNIAEALCSGVPVIVSGAGAVTDFCDHNSAYLVNGTWVTCTPPYCANARTVFNQPTDRDIMWFEPNIEHLASLMQHVRLHMSEALQKANRARQRCLQQLSWRTVSHTLLETIARLTQSCG